MPPHCSTYVHILIQFFFLLAVVNEDILLVESSKPHLRHPKRRPTTSITLAAYINWGGRIYLWKKMADIKNLFPDMKVYMANTDSIVISIPKLADLSKIDIHPTKNGCFKHQIIDSKNILRFFALSPVAYHFSYENNFNKFKQLNKVSGFKINTLLSKNFTSDKFESLIESFIVDKQEAIEINQLRTDQQKIVLFHLRNNLNKTRIISKDFTSKPFGFNFQE